MSNTAGATSWDQELKQAAEVEKGTGVFVLPHSVKKPGCGPEIMAYFKQHPETGVTDPSHVAVVGDRLMTDVMLANMMGAWGFWVRDGVVPLKQKSLVSSLPVPRASGGLTGCSFREWSETSPTFCYQKGSKLRSRKLPPRMTKKSFRPPVRSRGKRTAPSPMALE